MQVVGAVCKIKGERVALVVVQESVIAYESEAERYVGALAPSFEGNPVLLMAQTEGGVTWYGRSDLVAAMGEISQDQIPWQQMELNI